MQYSAIGPAECIVSAVGDELLFQTGTHGNRTFVFARSALDRGRPISKIHGIALLVVRQGTGRPFQVMA